MANVFMCYLEEQLEHDSLMPQLYGRYVDDTLVRMPDADVATEFLTTLNGLPSSLTFRMESNFLRTVLFLSSVLRLSRTED